jgi:DNA-binding transcriptional MocR family regulator
LSDAVAQHLPGAVQMKPPLGGFFLWLRLPGPIDTAELRRRARKQLVSFQPGGNFSYRRRLQNWLRLCFVYYPEKKLIEGVRRLAAVVD